MTRIVFTGGGTAGHITPNIALIQKIKEKHPDYQILYIGSKKGPEATMIPEIDVDFKGIYTGKLRRYFSWQNFIDFFRIPIGVIQSFFILRKFKPKVVFSKGGYVSIPVTYAASWLKIPIILHESDVLPGLANSMAAKKASVVCMAFDECKVNFPKDVKKVLTGNPIREYLLKGSPEKAYKMTDFSKDKPVILVMGGSQGAKNINEALINALPKIDSQVIHITGKGKKIRDNSENYKSFEYLNKELADIYSITDLVVCRSGANSLAEIEAIGIPAILIPIGRSASRGEQTLNAIAYKKVHPDTIIINDEDLTPGKLGNAVSELANKNTKKHYENYALNRVIEVIENYVTKN
jgi:UDP-N-acetylglucosamine--N-acetylmuramyl-(pentapeptide) pyrophosphoryl-undecaprenol N-acetylglucosamine transferase